MRHGWTVCPTLIVIGLGTSADSAGRARRRAADDRLGIRTVPIVLLTRSDVKQDLDLEPEASASCASARRVAFYDRAARLKGGRRARWPAARARSIRK